MRGGPKRINPVKHLLDGVDVCLEHYGEAATVDRMAEWIERLPLQSILGRDDSFVG